MIITKTPFRISFFGGGTDMPSFFNEHGGAVISTTFDKYAYVNVRHLPPFMPYYTELCYSRFERVNDVNDIEHPAIREAMRMLDIHEIRLTYEGDLPARTGLGTSSTFAVGMLNAFYALKGKYVGKRKLAEDAIYLERSFNCAHFLQSKDRIHRYGLPKDTDTHYYYILSADSVDETIDYRLKEKERRMLDIIENTPIPLFLNTTDEGDADIKAILNDYVRRKARKVR